MSNPKIHLVRGVATRNVNGKIVPVTEIDDKSCDCFIDTCNCAFIMTDLESGDKYALVIVDGVLSLAPYADFQAYKESGDLDDLNETPVAGE